MFSFFILFRANVFQVKLEQDVTIIIRGSNSFGSVYNIQKEMKSKYMKHRKQPLRGFLRIRFYDTLTLK